MKVTFDRVLNVLLLVAVVYGVTLLRPTAPRALPPYAAGEQAPTIAGLPYAANRTAVLFVRSNCHFCTESMPFYQELVKGGAKLVAISSEPKESLDAYLSEHGLAIDSATVKLATWPKLSGTPTMVIVDSRGKVVGSWIGLLSDADQRRVRDLLQ